MRALAAALDRVRHLEFEQIAAEHGRNPVHGGGPSLTSSSLRRRSTRPPPPPPPRRCLASCIGVGSGLPKRGWVAQHCFENPIRILPSVFVLHLSALLQQARKGRPWCQTPGDEMASHDDVLRRLMLD